MDYKNFCKELLSHIRARRALMSSGRSPRRPKSNKMVICLGGALLCFQNVFITEYEDLHKQNYKSIAFKQSVDDVHLSRRAASTPFNVKQLPRNAYMYRLSKLGSFFKLLAI